MRKRLLIALTVLLATVAGVVGWQALRPQEREPVYEGKGLRVWLSEYFDAKARRDEREGLARARGSEYQIKCKNNFQKYFETERGRYRGAHSLRFFEGQLARAWKEGKEQGL